MPKFAFPGFLIKWCSFYTLPFYCSYAQFINFHTNSFNFWIRSRNVSLIEILCDGYLLSSTEFLWTTLMLNAISRWHQVIDGFDYYRSKTWPLARKQITNCVTIFVIDITLYFSYVFWAEYENRSTIIFYGYNFEI